MTTTIEAHGGGALFREFETPNPSTPTSTQSSSPVSRAGAGVMLTAVVFLGSVTATSTGDQPIPTAALLAGGLTDRGDFAPVLAVESKPLPAVETRGLESRSDREEVTWIKEHSGLTWDQLGKIFGVSRRAVHMWASGGRLNESNARRLRAFSAIVREIEAGIAMPGPETVRARLLQIESDGLSVVDRLRRERSAGPTWGAPFGPERLVDALRDPVPTQVSEDEN